MEGKISSSVLARFAEWLPWNRVRSEAVAIVECSRASSSLLEH